MDGDPSEKSTEPLKQSASECGPNPNLLCRTCLCSVEPENSKCIFSKNEFTKYSGEQATFAEDIELISRTSIIEENNLPKLICTNCLQNLGEALKFIQTVQKSNEILHEKFAKSNQCFSSITIENAVCLSKEQYDDLEMASESIEVNEKSDEVNGMDDSIEIKEEILSDTEPLENVEYLFNVNVENEQYLNDLRKDCNDCEMLDDLDDASQKSVEINKKDYMLQSIKITRNEIVEKCDYGSWSNNDVLILEKILIQKDVTLNSNEFDEALNQISEIITDIDKKWRKCRRHKKRFICKYKDWLANDIIINVGEKTLLPDESKSSIAKNFNGKAEGLSNGWCNDLEGNKLNAMEDDHVLDLNCFLCYCSFDTETNLKKHVINCHSYCRRNSNENEIRKTVSVIHIKPKPPIDDKSAGIIYVKKVELKPLYTESMLKDAEMPIDTLLQPVRSEKPSLEGKLCGYCSMEFFNVGLFKAHIINCYKKLRKKQAQLKSKQQKETPIIVRR